jgi:hypothetical protein
MSATSSRPAPRAAATLVLLTTLAGVLGCWTGDANGFEQWPHEPAGFAALTTQAWQTLGSFGWGHANRAAESRVIVDGTAPFRPPTVLEQLYPVGFVAGDEPAVDWYPLSPAARGVFAAVWWRASAPWEGHPVLNKLTFITQADPSDTGPTANTILAFGPSPFDSATTAMSGPWTVRVALEYPTSNGHLAHSTGDDPGSRNLFGNSVPLIRQGDGWHLIELLLIKSTTTTSQDGVVRWWVDNHLAGDYTTVNSDQRPFKEFQIAPTWGGMGGTKTENDYLEFGPVHLSVTAPPDSAPSP